MGKKEKLHPKDSANFISCVTLWWIFELLSKGNSRPLEHEDLYSVRDEDGAENLTKRLLEKWENEKRWARESQTKPQFWKSLLKFFTWKEYGFIVFVAIVSIIGENIVWYSSLKLVDFIGSKLYNGKVRYQSFVYVYGIAMGQLVRSLSLNYFHLQGSILGIQARAAVVGLLYHKLLRLSKASVPAGYVMELLCDDSQRLVTSGEWFIQDGIRCFLKCACAIGWLLFFVGWQVVPGLLFLIFLGIYRFLIAKVDYKLRKNASRLADERLGYLREILTGVHSIKLNCFEEIFEEKIRHARRQEIKCKVKRWTIMAICFSFISCGQQPAIFVSILLLVFTDSTKLSYQSVFAIMIFIPEVCRTFSRALPTGIRLVIDVYMSLQRIQDLLASQDHYRRIGLHRRDNEFPNRGNISEESQITNIKSRQGKPPIQAEVQQVKTKKQIETIPYLSLCDVTCKLPSSLSSSFQQNCKNPPVLNYITLNISNHGLVTITGPVGSGKSSLLACVLDGELLLTNGVVKYSGNLAYVSDAPWIFPGTIRENILFGLLYNEEWYLKTIKACQLEKDLKDFPQGDMFRIGEQGATVSGGQRTRIALARAVYSQADIYLLDDPLSSLDAKVAENIFKYCLRGLLADRIILLTTSMVRFLKEADYIVKLQRGAIVAQGNFESVKDEMGEVVSGRHQHDEMSVEGCSTQDQKKTIEEIKEKEEVGALLLDEKEDRETGSVSFKVYRDYFIYGAPGVVLLLVVLVFLSGQVLVVIVDILVSRLPSLTKDEQRSQEVLITYAVLLVVAILLVILSTLCLLLIPMNAAYVLHNKMVSCLMSAPLSFYSTNPVGRIINRFSQDINNMDELLPNYFTMFCQFLFPALVALVLASVTNVILIPLGLATLLVFYFISRFYLRSAMDLKRLTLMDAGPLYSHFSSTMDGLRIIRVYKKQTEFTDKVYRLINSHNQSLFAYYTAVRWFSNTLDIVCAVFSTIVVVVVMMFSARNSSNKAIAALTILYAVNTVQTVQYVVRLFAEVHSQMTSVERTLAYTKIKAEKGKDINTKPPANWPHHGVIEFKNVSLWYYQDGPQALRNLTFRINAGEKIGIAGRTGAGKSSLVSALMRMANTEGEIIVDGSNTMELNVRYTRRSISVISQTPILLSGSIRLNLDPYSQFTESDIWDALEQMQMKWIISSLPNQLESVIVGTGSRFSVGERQLLHLARVLLEKSKIIVFDEATGKVDWKTDEIIQQTIRDVFKDYTVITIAHRLNTIMDCDRVMVLDRGEIVEFDEPKILLEKESGFFKQLQKISTSH